MKYSELKTKKSKMEFLRLMLSTNAVWAIRGLLKIYERQTEEEKEIQGTVEHNGVGFSGVDGDIMSSFAEQVLKGRNLSQKQMNIVFKKMPRYSRQLMEIAESK